MLDYIGTSFSLAFLVYPPLLYIVGNLVVFILKTLRPKAFPPGPPVFPGFGNVFQLGRPFPFLTFGSWAREYGKDTLLGFKKGTTNVIVLNSGRLVRELVEKRGAVYANRPWMYLHEKWIFKNDLHSAIFQNSSPWLTRWRREFNNHLGAAAIARLRPVYEAESARLLVKLLESPSADQEHLEDILVCWIMSVPCLVVCGRRPDYMTDVGYDIKEFRQSSDEYAILGAPNVGDLIPFLRNLPFFGMAQWKKRAQANREGVLKAGRQYLAVAKEQRAALDAGKSIGLECMLASMLRQQRDKNDQMFTTKDISNTAFHITSAAMATSTAVFLNIMMALAKYPEVQQRIRDEVLEVSGGSTLKASDLSSLNYTEAFWYEVQLPRIPQFVSRLKFDLQIHRWRPVAPQAIPHATSKDDNYEGKHIPKGTTVIMNVWHINHNEEDFEEPEKFNPDRYLHHPLGMRLDQAHDPANMETSSRPIYDFGAGRRVCPGAAAAKQGLLLGLAKILWAFDILPRNDKDLDMSLETGYTQKVALHPNDCDVVLKLRDGRSMEDILEHYSQAYEAEAQMMGWEGGLYK